MKDKTKWELLEGLGFFLVLFGLATLFGSSYSEYERLLRAVLGTFTGIPGGVMMSYAAWKIRFIS